MYIFYWLLTWKSVLHQLADDPFCSLGQWSNFPSNVNLDLNAVKGKWCFTNTSYRRNTFHKTLPCIQCTCKRRNVYQYYNLYTYFYLLSGKAERKANKRRKQTPLRNQTERRLYHHRRVHLRMRNKNQSAKKVWVQSLPWTALRLCHLWTLKE